MKKRRELGKIVMEYCKKVVEYFMIVIAYGFNISRLLNNNVLR